MQPKNTVSLCICENFVVPSLHAQFSVVQLGPAASLPFLANVPAKCTANLVHAVINYAVL
jgi:hypothetical protein